MLNTRTCEFLGGIMIYSRRNLEFGAFRKQNTNIWVWLMITLWQLVLFFQNWSQSIAFVELYKQNTRQCVFLGEIIIHFRRNVSWISQTEHVYLGKIDDNSLKTHAIPSKLVSIDSIRCTLQAKHENMCVSLRNNDLFLKKLRFSCISPTEHDVLVKIDDLSKETRHIPSKLVWIYSIRWTLQAEHKNMCVSRRNVDFSAFRKRNTTIWVKLIISLWKLVLFLQK